MESYLNQLHHDSDTLHVTACTEGGDCETCGRDGQQFYVSGGPGPARKMCEPCACAAIRKAENNS